MAKQNSVTFLPEGASSNRPPGFNGEHYYYWKNQMKLFLESQDTDIWDIVENGPFTPTIPGPVPNSRIPKPKADWTTEEKHKVLQ